MIGRIVHAMANCIVSSQTSMAFQNAVQPAARALFPVEICQASVDKGCTSAPPRTDRHFLECRRVEVTSSDNDAAGLSQCDLSRRHEGYRTRSSSARGVSPIMSARSKLSARR